VIDPMIVHVEAIQTCLGVCHFDMDSIDRVRQDQFKVLSD